jgi:hypothetical protein
MAHDTNLGFDLKLGERRNLPLVIDRRDQLPSALRFRAVVDNDHDLAPSHPIGRWLSQDRAALDRDQNDLG